MTHILFIGDDQAVIESTKFILITCGFKVSTAPDGRVGLERFAAETPDLVITDIFMPEMEGLETIRSLRARHPDIPILAISGGWRTSGVDWLDMAAKLGATATLRKPFDENQLLRAIDRCLASRDTMLATSSSEPRHRADPSAA